MSNSIFKTVVNKTILLGFVQFSIPTPVQTIETENTREVGALGETDGLLTLVTGFIS